jgi:hypothetical protein
LSRLPRTPRRLTSDACQIRGAQGIWAIIITPEYSFDFLGAERPLLAEAV